MMPNVQDAESQDLRNCFRLLNYRSALLFTSLPEARLGCLTGLRSPPAGGSRDPLRRASHRKSLAVSWQGFFGVAECDQISNLRFVYDIFIILKFIELKVS